MELNIRLPGDSPDSLVSFAKTAIPLAFAHAKGASSPLAPPSHTANACDGVCEYVDSCIDERGNLWLMYCCQGNYRCYPA